jgi:hypothetical protein
MGRGSVLRVISLLSFGLAATGLAVTGGWGQSAAPAGEDLHGLKVIPVKLQPTPTPFPLDVSTGRIAELEFRAPEAMTAEDRSLAEGAQTEIARRAGLQGFRLREDAGWGYEQAVCPAFPDHIILEYSRLEGDDRPGDATLFSAVVPRGGEDHVRVIPVRRRGYSLWTPSSQNSLTMHDFNHMVKQSGLPSDWWITTLCYTALAGGHVRGSLVPRTPEEEHYPLPTSPMITVSKKGGAEIRFVDAGPATRRGEWVLEFAQNGELKKVRRVKSSELREYPTKESVVDLGAAPGAGKPE